MKKSTDDSFGHKAIDPSDRKANGLPCVSARILLVDDDLSHRGNLKMTLRNQGYQVEEASEAGRALEMAADFHPHLVILCWDLAQGDAGSALSELRSWTDVPVLALTCHDRESMKVKILDAGADDCMIKPVGLLELLARVRVSLRIHGLIEATPIFRSGDLTIDLNGRWVARGESKIKITHTEFKLLTRLVREHGKAVEHATLLKHVWGAASDEHDHYLRIYINQLRKKVEVDPSHPQHILTETGVGYRLV